MEFFSVQKHELRDLWVVIALALVFALYVTMVTLAPCIERMLAQAGSDFPFAVVVNNMLAVWLAGLMWVAYRRWRGVLIREQELADIFFSINPVVLMVIDAHGTIVSCNPAVKEVLDFDPPDLEGESINLLIPGLSTSHSTSPEVEQALSRKGYSLTDMPGKKKNGEPILLEVITCNLRGRQGTISLIKDITDRVQAEQALRTAKEDLEEANRIKSGLLRESEKNYAQLKELEVWRDSLVHMIVHDMKSPLQVIMTSLEVLNPEDLTESTPVGDQRDLLDIAKTDSRRLLTMITSLLDVSRFESGDKSMDVQPCDLKALFESWLKSIMPLLQERRIHQNIPEQPVQLACDSEMIQRVCDNLMDNALKYTHAGDPIHLRLTTDGTWARIAIQDSGTGIDPAHHALIFEKFGRIRNKNASVVQPASGLGLAFCKLAVEAHGGEIGVESNLGTGSTFWFTLPMQSPIPNTESLGLQ